MSMDPFYSGLDEIMHEWSSRLRDDVKLTPEQSRSLASTMRTEIKSLDPNLDLEDVLPRGRRLEVFDLYQVWRGSAAHVGDAIFNHPGCSNLPPVTVKKAWATAAWIVDVYVGLVYCSESVMDKLRKQCGPDTVTRKVFYFLRSETEGRAFRNAFAHGNWEWEPPDKLKFWAKKGQEKTETMTAFEMRVQDSRFYVDLTCCAAWAALLALKERA